MCTGPLLDTGQIASFARHMSHLSLIRGDLAIVAFCGSMDFILDELPKMSNERPEFELKFKGKCYHKIYCLFIVYQGPMT